MTEQNQDFRQGTEETVNTEEKITVQDPPAEEEISASAENGENIPAEEMHKEEAVPTEPVQEPEKKQKRKRHGGLIWLAVLLLLAGVSLLVVLCAILVPGSMSSGNLPDGTQEASVSTQTPSKPGLLLPTSTPQPTGHAPQEVPHIGGKEPPVIGTEEPIADIAEALAPSVVSITIYRETMNLTGITMEIAGYGSGIVVTEDGYVVTNAHVIRNYNKITVTLNDKEEKEEYEAKVVGYDSIYDIAVLRIDAQDLKPAVFGDSSKIRTGQYVLAIGDPNGYEGSVTLGIISAVDREVVISNRRVHMIQTDAAINPGNSGGALVNMKGEVIGINSGKTSGITASGATLEGLGFAIPSNTAKEIIYKLIETGQVKRAGLGITGSSYNQAGITGAMVESVNEGSAADKGGLKPKDLIVEVDGEKVTSFADLSEILFRHNPGDTIRVTVNRNSIYLTFNVTLDELVLE